MIILLLKGSISFMPRPRFNNLSQEKKHIITQAAMKEFADKSYEHASINNIIRTAGLTKGSFYYYFDDKEDLYLYIMNKDMQNWWNYAIQKKVQIDVKDLWGSWENMVKTRIEFIFQNPYSLGLFRNMLLLYDKEASSPMVENIVNKNRAPVESFLKIGQSIGIIRNDFPVEFLFRMMMAVLSLVLKWGLVLKEDITEEQFSVLAKKIIHLIKQILSPYQLTDEEEADFSRIVSAIQKAYEQNQSSQRS